MPSPFPGMDPYLEQEDVWHDFHQRFIPSMANAIAASVHPVYITKVTRRVGEPGQFILGDFESEAVLEIRHRVGKNLITVVDLLSPVSHKIDPDTSQHPVPPRQVLSRGASLVEINLLRGYPKPPRLKEIPNCDYWVTVTRAEERRPVEVSPLSIRDRLPAVAIPLRPTDADVRLDLHQLIHQIYDAAGYKYYIYSASPQPPLTPEQAEWAAEFLPKPC